MNFLGDILFKFQDENLVVDMSWDFDENLCAGCRMWTIPESKGITRRTAMEEETLNLVSEGCNPKSVMSYL